MNVISFFYNDKLYISRDYLIQSIKLRCPRRKKTGSLYLQGYSSIYEFNDIEGIKCSLQERIAVPWVRLQCPDNMEYENEDELEKNAKTIADLFGIIGLSSALGLDAINDINDIPAFIQIWFEDITDRSDKQKKKHPIYVTKIIIKPTNTKVTDSNIAHVNRKFTLDTTDPEVIARWLVENKDQFIGEDKRSKYLESLFQQRDFSVADAGSGEPPEPFGFKMIWYAVRSMDQQAVAREVGLVSEKSTSWNEGIRATYECEDGSGKIFLSAPIGPWILIIGYDPNLDLQNQPKKYNPLVCKLSERFGEAHFYGTHRTVEWHAWAKAIDGELVRGYAYNGEHGEVTLKIGRRTSEETALGLKFDGVESVPDEQDVIDLAAAWSVDPQLRNIKHLDNVGIIGHIDPSSQRNGV